MTGSYLAWAAMESAVVVTIGVIIKGSTKTQIAGVVIPSKLSS